MDRLHASCRYYDAHGSHVSATLELRVLCDRPGSRSPRFAVVAQWRGGARTVVARVSAEDPLTEAKLERLAGLMVGTGYRGRHYRMDMVLVSGGVVRADFGYSRPKKHHTVPRDNQGPTAYVCRALLRFFRAFDVPVPTCVTVRDALRGRAAGLGDCMPFPAVFR